MPIFNVRNYIQFMAVTTFLHFCRARSIEGSSSVANSTDSQIWQPKEGTRSEWMNCHGMPKNVCERTKFKYQLLQEMLVKARGLEDMNDRLAKEVSALSINSLDGCIWLTEEQIDMLMAVAKQPEGATLTRRKKRTMTNLHTNVNSKWPMPIHFKFDGTHEEKQKATIRGAFQHWMDNTCARFKELATDAPFNDNHILITSQFSGCYSYVGRTYFKPQPINLQSACLIRFGTPVHEIGHTLGLWHEQMRSDRDSAIQIVWSNINQNYVSQFSKADTDSYGLPYNYGSVMQYSSKEGVSINGKDTMIALDPLYQMNMGQRTGLSFNDIKLINLAYCQGSCTTPLSQPCLRGGYQNPNSCSSCLCSDGFSGQFCDRVAPSKFATCGGVINIASGGQQTIKSPGYDDRRYYFSNQECSWWIKAPENYKLQLTFAGEFGLYAENDACYHWVEIKHKKDLGLEGGRFCGRFRPNVTVTSQSNELMIVFRSNYTMNYYAAQRGFQADIRTINPSGGNNPVPSSAPSTSTTRTTTIPTTTTTRSTPTTTPTTTVRTTMFSSKSTSLQGSTKGSAAQQSLWRCSFETTPSGDSLCGMIQDTTDQFDWTVFHDPTPSDPTGPDFPYDGNFYIYIEASAPRQPNDEARLFFPKLTFAGEVCVDFYYHMYGFHINTLKLVRITDSQSTIVWMKSYQMENAWLHGLVGVNLSSSSQLQFVGIRGNEYSGDIGLDKIEVKSGPCVV